jgi:DnaJ family protein C protein 3
VFQRKGVVEAVTQLVAARKAYETKQWDSCIASTSSAIATASQNAELRELRSKCYIGKGDVEQGAGDLLCVLIPCSRSSAVSCLYMCLQLSLICSRAVSLNPSSHTLLVRLSLISYLFLHEPSQQAFAPVKQCLHFDPESKLCKSVFRRLKSLEKDVSRARNFIEASQWREAVKILDPSLLDSVRETLTAYPDYIPTNLDAKDSRLLRELLKYTCRAHSRSGSSRLASRFCDEVLKYEPNNVDGLVGKGDDLMRKEEYQEAANVYSRAFEEGGRQDREVMDKLQKAQMLLKRSKQKDYYKVRVRDIFSLFYPLLSSLRLCLLVEKTCRFLEWIGMRTPRR